MKNSRCSLALRHHIRNAQGVHHDRIVSSHGSPPLNSNPGRRPRRRCPRNPDPVRYRWRTEGGSSPGGGVLESHSLVVAHLGQPDGAGAASVLPLPSRHRRNLTPSGRGFAPSPRPRPSRLVARSGHPIWPPHQPSDHDLTKPPAGAQRQARRGERTEPQ